MPLRLRLTLITTLLMAVVLSVMGLFLRERFDEALRYTLEKGLRSRAQTVVTNLEGGDSSPGGEGELIETDEAFTQILARDGAILSSSPGISERPLVSGATRPVSDAMDDDDDDGTRLMDALVDTTEHPVPAMVLVVPASQGRTVIVGASIEDEQEALAEMTGNLVAGGGVALIASAFVGWLVAGFALRPVERLRLDAASISADDGKQVAVPKTHDELQRLGVTLNEMIERMRSAVEHERRFVDDASHELRTPLSILRTELDVALRRDRTAEELTNTVRSAHEETERLQRLSEDLLLLARSDRDGIPVRKEEIDLASTLRSTANRHGSAIAVDVSDGLAARVDPLRLRQALDNLLTNAIRHDRSDGGVTLSAREHAGVIEIAVEDRGPGFSPTFLPRAFDPFTRADEGRTRTDGGTGLGLAIVKAIALAHGGSVEASNRPIGGARVTLRLPR